MLAYDTSSTSVDIYRPAIVMHYDDVITPLKPAQINASRIRIFNADALTARPTLVGFEAFSPEFALQPTEQLTKLHASSTLKYRRAFAAALQRIKALKIEAQSINHVVSYASEKDKIDFLSEHPFVTRPFISLLDNGNLRALWKNEFGEQIGLQFLGNKQIQYVLFARRGENVPIARSAGRDTLANIRTQIQASNLGHLLTA
jgi:hypothetical protein